MELKSGATFDAKVRDVDEKADIALIKIDAPVSRQSAVDRFTSRSLGFGHFFKRLLSCSFVSEAQGVGLSLTFNFSSVEDLKEVQGTRSRLLKEKQLRRQKLFHVASCGVDFG